jgi:hypothetical protein
MNYLTVEVEIDHGRIVARGSEKLPDKATALLTILQPTEAGVQRPYALAKDEFTVPDDFNAPLPPEVLRDFEPE